MPKTLVQALADFAAAAKAAGWHIDDTLQPGLGLTKIARMLGH